MYKQIETELRRYIRPDKAAFLPHFFKTGLGEYGEGDKFLGIMVPDVRTVVKEFWQQAAYADVTSLLRSPWHEERLAALLILVRQYAKGNDAERAKIFRFYLDNTKFINNWDLVDLSCVNIVGRHLYDYPSEQKEADRLVGSKLLWDRRIAVVGSQYFLRQGDPSMSLYVIRRLLTDKEELIQKANGWTLRELGKRIDRELMVEFIKEHYDTMPRTTLRYAIEHLSDEVRKQILAGDFQQI